LPQGYLALILHAHLPYVRHVDQPAVLEEKWLFEAMTECYIPLIGVFNRLTDQQVDFRVTLSLSPPIITMLKDSLLQERYVGHLTGLLALAEAELERTALDPFFSPVVHHYRDRLSATLQFYRDCGGNILTPLARLSATGRLELITCCATHGYLPLMLTWPARRAQVAAAVDLFAQEFGHPPVGIWLPECGYTPGMDEILKDYGIAYFTVDTHGLLNARPTPTQGVYAPLYCPSGVAAFARDPESSRQVWDRVSGYPGDYSYREFYRDIGYDLDQSYIARFLPTGGVPGDTGLKYYRITGPGSAKEPYRPALALARASVHAANFVFNRGQQVRYLAGRTGNPPLVVAPYDAELFGHWWYEGPQWLEFALQKIHYDQDEVRTITPGDYLRAYPENEVAVMDMSSWGAGGYSEMWLNPSNDWLYRHLHRAENLMVELADLYLDSCDDHQRRALDQAARELLLAQSSDWAFILKTGTDAAYAERRTFEHLSRFNTLNEQLRSNRVDPETVASLEEKDKIFPGLDFSVYSRHSDPRTPAAGRRRERLKILMLSWEFPPRTVGGLGRAVHDLSRSLAREGHQVHVVTAPAEGTADYTMVDGVHVYRVDASLLPDTEFLPWVDRLNREMAVIAGRLARSVGPDVIHAHDWLVGGAATELRDTLGFPLVVTIHATEHGRHRGIHNELQHNIHDRETGLMQKAGMIILCSRYMADEVTRVFGIDPAKLHMIPNGVEPAALKPEPRMGDSSNIGRDAEKVIAFLGRLVPEKGVHILLRAMPAVLRRFPGARVVIGGRGPYEGVLRQLACDLGMEDRVTFAGFLNEPGRNRLLNLSRVAVFPSLYEPFGIVALEAMASRVPVIVSDTGGLMEVVEHGIDGFKVQPDQPDILAEYINLILTNPGLATELCARAWRKVLIVYDWKYIAQETAAVYAAAMNGRNAYRESVG
jgi:1,4-alpha-glucan branching enzyme